MAIKCTNLKKRSLRAISNLQKEGFRIGVAVIVVLLLMWSITVATTDDFASATNNFSVIGTVSSISDDTISLIGARGTDTTEEELYNLNIEHLEEVETKDYEPLIISDISPGNTIIAQGVTDGNTFFIKRIVSFSDIIMPLPVNNATSTDEVMATTTPEVEADLSSEGESVTLPIEDLNSTSTDEVMATTTPEVEADLSSEGENSEASLEEQNADATPLENTEQETVIDTVSDILEDGLDNASNVLDSIVDTITDSDVGEIE